MEEQTGTALPWYDEVFRAGVEDASQATDGEVGILSKPWRKSTVAFKR
jgi:hypothetical protein